MASVIIDGYNLIGICHRDLEAQRERLIELLIKYNFDTRHDITVVFDGWKGGCKVENVSVRGGVKIIYSRLGEKADDVIKRIISSDRREWLVISSDRDIAAYAWATGSIPIEAEVFIPFIETAHKEPRDSIEGDTDKDETASGMQRGGNPRQLSKKEKAIRRAVSKL